jgi:hypothetical protein
MRFISCCVVFRPLLRTFLLCCRTPENEKTYPILSLFLADEQRMRGLRYLPHIIEWQSLLYARYNRSLERGAAGKMTVGDVLNAASDQARWYAAFEGFAAAWNSVWHFVGQEGCLVIPSLYRTMKMGLSTPISFSLPADRDEGMCPLALSRFLGERHNQVVHRLDEVLLMRGKDLQRYVCCAAVLCCGGCSCCLPDCVN